MDGIAETCDWNSYFSLDFPSNFLLKAVLAPCVWLGDVFCSHEAHVWLWAELQTALCQRQQTLKLYGLRMDSETEHGIGYNLRDINRLFISLCSNLCLFFFKAQFKFKFKNQQNADQQQCMDWSSTLTNKHIMAVIWIWRWSRSSGDSHRERVGWV